MGRFINADAYASTGQGILGNNMFAYCLNNPVAYIDTSGTAAYVCWGYDEQPNEDPWKEASSCGGGRFRDTYYSRQDYGSVADKFYTVLAWRILQSQIARCNEIKAFNEMREDEFRRQKEALALKKAESYVSNPLALADTIFREVGLAGTLAGLYIEAGLIAVSPAGAAVLTAITAIGMIWSTVDYAVKEVMVE